MVRAGVPLFRAAACMHYTVPMNEKAEAMPHKSTEAPSVPEQEQAQRILNETGEKMFRLGMVFKKRTENNYDELLSRDATSRLMQVSKVLSGPEPLDETRLEQITQSLNELRSALDSYGTYRTSGGMRDDVQNLRSVTIFANEAAMSVKSLERNFQMSNREPARNASAQLVTTLEKIRDGSISRTNAVNRYLRK